MEISEVLERQGSAWEGKSARKTAGVREEGEEEVELEWVGVG